MKYLSQLDHEALSEKRVLVRLDLNVPLSDDGTVHDEDADRIRKSMPTLELLRNAGARIVIISHIGRDPKETLAPVAAYMNIPLHEGLAAASVADAPIVMLENLRSHAGEEDNDEAFASQLATFGDIYVNDAFAVSHRAHASVVGVPKLLPSYAGLQLEQEIKNLSQAFNPEHPSVLVLGGAKFETKLPVIEKFLPIVDHVLIGGALANNLYKERGYEIGRSLIDADANVSAIANHASILLPETVIVESAHGQAEKNISDIESGDKIVDMAPAGLGAYADIFAGAQFVIWNGPMGNYENGFTSGSKSIVDMIATSSAHSIAGGGDSVALIEQLGLEDRFSFLSTGGGAMLEYLAQGTLPGIEALEE